MGDYRKLQKENNKFKIEEKEQTVKKLNILSRESLHAKIIEDSKDNLNGWNTYMMME